METGEVNVAVFSIDEVKKKEDFFKTIKTIGDTITPAKSGSAIVNTHSSLKASMTLNLDSKEYQVTFIDGDKNIGSNSSDILTDTIYDVGIGLVLFSHRSNPLIVEKCENVLLKILDRYPNSTPIMLEVIANEEGVHRQRSIRQSFQPPTHGKQSQGIMKQFLNLKCDVTKNNHVMNLINVVIKENILLLQKKNQSKVAKQKLKSLQRINIFNQSEPVPNFGSLLDSLLGISRSSTTDNYLENAAKKNEEDEGLESLLYSGNISNRRDIQHVRLASEETDSISVKTGFSISFKNKRPQEYSLIHDNDITLSNTIIMLPAATAEKELTQDKIKHLVEENFIVSLAAIAICHQKIFLNFTSNASNDYQIMDKFSVIPSNYSFGEIGENFLHIFAWKNCRKEIELLFTPKYIQIGLELCKMKTLTGYTPIAIAARAKHSELAEFLTQQILVGFSDKDLKQFMLSRDKHGKNILNICCWNSCSSILDMILASSISESVIGEALSNPAGYGTNYLEKWGETPLMHKNVPEETILRGWPILKKNYKLSGICHQTAKGRTYAHEFAGNNNSKALQMFIREASMQRARTIDILKDVDCQGNNVFHKAAIENASDALVLCLGHLIVEGNQEDKYEVLHRKNKRSQSLLEIVLYHKETLLVPQHMILSIEREIHQDFESLSRCFRDNLKLQTSGEVYKILTFMKGTLPKSEASKVITKITIFADIFLVPFTVMLLDIITDILVVINYAYVALLAMKEEKDTFAQELTNYRYTESLSFLERFCYSLSFLLIPWVFYLLEFMNSPMRKSQTAQRILEQKSCVLWACGKFYVLLRSVLLITFWPIAQLFMKVINAMK